ncbi:fatty acid desaturase, partial [Burkholderia pseudomallei]
MNDRIRSRDLFTRDEIRALTARSNWRGAGAVGSTWAVIALAFSGLASARAQFPAWGFALA